MLGALLALTMSIAWLTGCGAADPVAARDSAATSPAPPSGPGPPGPSGSPDAAKSPPASPGAAATPRPTPTPPPALPHPAVADGWVGPIYAPHRHGYDISYPQCPPSEPPAGAAFSILGVNGGRAFTVNPCLREQWLAGRGTQAVYFNSGYDPDNAGHVTADCRWRSQFQEGGDARRTAYAIGCSEAVFAVNTMNAAGAGRAAMIWLDVESSNSWDPADPDLNRTALQAEIDQLAAYGRLVGLYGTFAEWHGIVGDWTPAGIVADWVAGRSSAEACGAPGFSGHPVWIAQELSTWPSPPVDSDWTC